MSSHPLPVRARAVDRRALVAMIVVGALVAYLVQALFLPVPRAAAVAVGSGSYAEGTPSGGAVPTECNGTPVTNPRAHVTSNFPAGAIPTNDWWTSLLWRKFDCNAISENLVAHPLTFKAFTNGLGVSYPTTPSVSGTSTGVSEYHYSYAEDFRLGVAGLSSDGKVDGYSDWTVSELWTNGSSSLRTTFGHGLPFVYATKTGGNATLTTTGTPTVWSNTNAALGFTVNGHDYAAFAPSGSTWNISGSSISSSLNGKDFFSVAVLPTGSGTSTADKVAALNAYATYAHNHVTGTKVSWSYDESTARMTATYAFTTTAKQGSATGTVYALYPHQRDQLAGVTPSSYAYVSPRGPMRVVIGSSQFQTVTAFNGVLPQLAATGFTPGSADATQLNGYVDQVAATDPFAGFGEDTYWTGKAFGRAAQVIQIANLTGNTTARDELLASVKTRLTDWMTASSGETQRAFWYNPSWGTLIGYPASYGSDTDLNDHHFHYGYYVVAAANVAQFDPSWAADSAYGGMVNTVIKDAANWDRSDTRFPFLRDFDIYAGHDWASGHGAFGAGNNQESSSEGMNFASGLIQWGQATGNKTVRDLGIYLYTTQASAIENYWFDTDDEAFPASFGHSTVGMVWGDGGAYSTWFSAEPEMIQGINLLPSTAGHLYLGYNSSYIGRNLTELERNNGGKATVWKDIIWEFQALADAPTALSEFRSQAGSYTVEEGESRAHTFYWLKNLSVLGTVDRSVTANTPLHAVFVKNGTRTYQAANMGSSAITVTFSNGVTLSVPARSVASTTGGSTGGDTTAPSTPSGLSASGTTSSSTSLSWSASTDNVGVTGYEVLRNGTVVGSTSGTTYSASGLSAGTTYTFAVRAYDAAGNRSSSSTSISVSTPSGTGSDTTAPSTPSGLAASGTTSSSTTLAWSASTDNVGVTGYEVLRNGTVVGSTTGTTYTASGLSASTAYTFAVRAYDAAGNRSATSGSVSVTTSAGTGTGVDATSRIQAEAFNGQSGTATEATSDTDGGLNVAWIGNGDHLRFDNVRFGSTARTQFSARVASGAAAGVSGLVVVRLDSLTAQPVGSFAIGSTGGWQTWKTVPTNIAGVTGTHTVYLTFESGQPADFVNVNWFTFQ
ncbi:carbohydrate-binding protein [Cellulomonas septica]|uniref:glucan endo-1,3-beta-D-glucosidase n=1 Tax=Cellulomonas septica TaxID=285080 RepID=A0ABX1JVH8_9CELL|nr:glycosyl hydrolase [Cellulomonas septica]NKY38333.1 carbohydrate-binding protein [Cellulomonas septica]